MPITFSTSPKVTSQLTFGNVQDQGFFQTDFGTIYVRVGSQVVKLGNPQVPSHNEVAIKPTSYFASSRPVTLLADPTLSL